MNNKINPVNIKGATSIYIDAEINEKRDLLFSGQGLSRLLICSNSQEVQ